MLTAIRTRLTAQGVFPTEMAANYDAFDKLLRELSLLSTASLYPGRNTDAAALRDAASDIDDIGDTLHEVETLPEPLRSELTGTEDAKMALIADVHTDTNTGRVLEVGVGKAMQVTVPVTVNGAVFEVIRPHLLVLRIHPAHGATLNRRAMAANAGARHRGEAVCATGAIATAPHCHARSFLCRRG